MMSDTDATSAEQEREEAFQWAMLILADHHAVPDPTALDKLGEHQAAFSAWVNGKPSREAHYLDIVRKTLGGSNDALRAGMRSSGHRPLKKGSLFHSPIALAAAFGCVLAAAAGIWWRSQGVPPSLIAQSEARTPVETRVGEVRTERLADGSSVILDTDTLLLVSMTSQQRRVEIKRGRARFTVVQDDPRPFVVTGAGTNVATYGGSFDMAVRSGARISPIKGSLVIGFTRVARAGQPKNLELRAGQLLIVEAGQEADISVIPAPRSEQQWVGGVKSFDNVPINEVIAEANSYSETKIELATPALGNREIFADIDIRDIERVAQALSAFLDLTIDRSQPNKLILTEKK
ncbi:FecR domain-containing protein [Sphingobium sp. BHU LFT2]|nr:FecR domain-containing protein [Sphingobium sp. BHU LFT2]